MKRGLTFVELLLAVAVFAILLTGLSSHLRGSVIVWRRVTSTTEHLQRIRVTFDRLRNDLAQAFVFAPKDVWTPDPKFEDKQLTCYTLQASQKTTDGAKVVFITYSLGDGEEKTTLIRKVQSPQEAHAKPTGSGEKERFLEHVKELTIHYGQVPRGQKDITWSEPWKNQPNVLPKLVKVTVTFEKEVPEPRTVQQMFVIPVGTVPVTP